MKEQEIHLELLMGKQVTGVTGEPVGRLEEVVAELKGSECLIAEFHVGIYATFERLAAWSIGRAVLRLFGGQRQCRGYRIPWAKLDLSKPDRPRLRCPVSELERLPQGSE